jgi:hypothetical protein
LLETISAVDFEAMKKHFTQKHYQIFFDCLSDFTPLLPQLVDGFFNAFGADFKINDPR